MSTSRDEPQVSVLMPVRDGERFLADAIASVLEQSLATLELVVIDDGSSDRTPMILAGAAAKDTRVTVLRQRPLGLCAALNRGVQKARAPLLARLDADDVALRDRLERQVAFLESRPDVALVGGGVIVIDAAGRELDRELGPRVVDLSNGNPLWHSTVLMRKSAFEEAGGYRLAPAEDYDLWLRIAERHRLASVHEPVVRYRLHSGQTSLESISRQAITALAVRAAADVRRRGANDPLVGVATVDDELLVRLGVDHEAVRDASISAAIEWAAALERAGRHSEADRLLADTSRRYGSPTLSALRRASHLKLARRAAYRRQPARAVRHLLRATFTRPLP